MIIPNVGLRIYKKKPKQAIIDKPPIEDPNGKTISFSDIKKFTYGISSENLRKRFKNMKNSNLRFPHLFFSILTKKRSIDLYMDEQSIIKWFYGISHYLKESNEQFKIMSTSKFLLTKLKLKMLLNLKEYYEKNSHEMKNNKYGKIINDIVSGKISLLTILYNLILFKLNFRSEHPKYFIYQSAFIIFANHEC